MHIFGSAGSADWWTPQVVIDLLHDLFPGDITDLAADVESAQRLGAPYSYCAEYSFLDNCPEQRHAILSAFCNPPGGKTRLTQRFWVACAEAYERGVIRELLWLSFSIDMLQTTQGKGVPSILDYPTWVPASRLPYYSPYKGRELPGLRPSAITFMGASRKREAKFFALCAARIPGAAIIPTERS